MTKINNLYLNIYKSQLLITNGGLFFTSGGCFIPITVLGINHGLKTISFVSYTSCVYFKNFFLLSRTWFTKKLKFRHKISWFYMKRRSCKLFICQIGKSHLLFQPLLTYISRKKRYTTSNSLIFFGLNWHLLQLYCTHTKSGQPINPYTLRGLRFSRQLLYKRQGKVSKYSGLKSKIF